MLRSMQIQICTLLCVLAFAAGAAIAQQPGRANLVGSPAPTTTALTLILGTNPSTYGQNLRFTATVSPQAAGAGTPTGMVSFYDGATLLETDPLDGSGQVTFVSSVLGTGSHSITAVYAGDSNFMTSTSPALGQIVNQATTTAVVLLTLGTNPSTYGQSLTFVAVVSPQFAGVPGGQVTFTDGGTAIATRPLSGDQAPLTTTSLPVGLHAIRAVYAGDANFLGVTSPPLQQTVNSANAPDVTLTFTPAIVPNRNNVLFRKRVALTATLSRSDATGTISFQDGPTLLGSATLASGVATLNVNPFTFGQHTITASYGGDANFGGNASQPVTFYSSPKPH